MQIIRKDIDALQAQIQIILEAEDYLPRYENELKKYRNKAQIKGFRKGMIPMNTLKKMYGKSILTETVYEELNNRFSEYIKENKIQTLGSPIPSEDGENAHDFDILQNKSYTFTFDVGIIPDYTISGVNETDQYDIDDITIDEDTLSESMQDFMNRNGKQEVVDSTVEENDTLDFHAVELNEDKSLKENGWHTEFVSLVNTIKDEETKHSLLGKKTGDTVILDVTKLESTDQSFIDKYILNKTEADADVEIGNYFSATIKSIKRIVPATLSDEFFEQLGDEKVKNEQDLRNVMLEEITKSYEKSAKNLLERKIFDRIKSDSNLEISRDFYKRLLQLNEQNKDVEITEEELEKSVENTKWMIMREDLFEKHNITVGEPELKNYFFNQVMGYFRYYPNMDYNVLFDFVEKQMKNKNAVERAEDEIKVGKLFEKLTDIVSKNPVTISSSDFDKKVKSLEETR